MAKAKKIDRTTKITKAYSDAMKARVKEKTLRGGGTGIGKPRAVETPEQLWTFFEEYTQWTIDNPFKLHTHTVRGVKQYIDKQRVTTFSGFEGWLCLSNIVYDLKNYEWGNKSTAKTYAPIISKIRKVCSEHVIAGAMTGIYNGNLAARLEGIKENIVIDDSRKEVGDIFPEILDGE